MHGIEPRYSIDKNKELHVKWGVPVIDYGTARERYQEHPFLVVIGAPSILNELRQVLATFMRQEHIFAFEYNLFWFIKDADEYRQWLIKHEKDFQWTYDILQDDFSRKTFENVLRGRVTNNFDYFRGICQQHQYFDEKLIKIPEQGVILDAGACNGDTLLSLNEITGGRFDKVYCFEPDKAAYGLLCQTAEEFGDKVIPVNRGCYQEKCALQFCEGVLGGSKIVDDIEAANAVIEVDSLDNMVDKSDRVVHIKMDIEGAEKYAIIGAKGIIKRDKPILAICVYHLLDDFWEIPKLIWSIVPEYKFYMRHYSLLGGETVIYAIV